MFMSINIQLKAKSTDIKNKSYHIVLYISNLNNVHNVMQAIQNLNNTEK